MNTKNKISLASMALMWALASGPAHGEESKIEATKNCIYARNAEIFVATKPGTIKLDTVVPASQCKHITALSDVNYRKRSDGTCSIDEGGDTGYAHIPCSMMPIQKTTQQIQRKTNNLLASLFLK